MSQSSQDSIVPGILTMADGLTITSIPTSGTYTIANSNSYTLSKTLNGVSPGALTLGDQPTISTNKHTIDVDELYEDVLAIKQILIELAKDENLLERNGVIRDILSGWLIKGLSK